MFWDEFLEVDDKTGKRTGNIAKGAKILFGQSFDSDIERLNKEADKQHLQDSAADSKHGRRFDIKTDTSIAPNGAYTGKLLNGVYVSARTAGNYLAGLNAMTGGLSVKFGIPIGHISPDTAQRLFGAFQVLNRLGKEEAALIFFNNKAYGPAPYYGEIEYSGRAQQLGIAAGFEKRNKR